MDKYEINNVSFTQDYNILQVAHDSGYMFYNTADLCKDEPLPSSGESTSEKTHVNLSQCYIAERLFSTNLMVLVTRKQQRLVYIYRVSKKQAICSHQFLKAVIAVRINMERIAVLFEDFIHIFDLKTAKTVHRISDLVYNMHAIFDMSTKLGTAILVHPDSNESGRVRVFNALTFSVLNTFSAHKSPLAHLKLNDDGTMLATASTRGTVIRVFSMPDGEMLHEFRRGTKRLVKISSLSFSLDSEYLASASDTETVHIYKLEKKLDGVLKSVQNLMPAKVKNVSDVITGDRSFAIARIPKTKKPVKVCIVSHDNRKFVIVASLEGNSYAYCLTEEGGELPFVAQHRIGPEVKPYWGYRENNENNQPIEEEDGVEIV